MHSANQAYELTVPADATGQNDAPHLTLGFTLSSLIEDHAVDSGKHAHLTNMYTVVEFEVDETASARIDLPIRDMPNMCYPSYDNVNPNGYTYNPWKHYWFHDGIRKTGKGTLTLTGVNENGRRVSCAFVYAPSTGTVTAYKNGLMIFLR